jgi:nicotinamide mononucleotide adenylyltransferase
MKTYKEFILEATNPDDYETQGSKPVDLFLGRLQPIHNGHYAIVKKMKNPVVAIVKGSKSSQDKDRNPFEYKYQEKLLKMLSKVEVIKAKTGYIPDIINDLRKSDKEVITVFVGDDRISSYERQITSFNKQMPDDKKINVKFTKTPRITSASKVRELIRTDNFAEFKKNVPKEIWKEWDNMKKIMGVD